MKTTELRIGNLVTINQTALHFDGSGKSDPIFEIGEIRTDLVYFKGFHTGEYCSSIQPIPLTEEWLVKLGSTKFPDGQSIVLNNRLIGYRECSNVFYDKSTGVNIQYVHQLQNLVYALTGEELTCN